MKSFLISWILLGLLQTITSSPWKLDSNLKGVDDLDDNGKIRMSWEVDKVKGQITFEIEAETSGYIGFGISPSGSMEGADIFIAGVDPQGVPYSSDRHATGMQMPVVDDHSDWTLLEAQEHHDGTIGITYLKFSRLLATCDDQDYPITNGTNRLIWALGTTDELTKHETDRKGSRSVNLLGAPQPNIDLELMSQMNATINMVMPDVETAYWCSLHKGPPFIKKHHIVAFDAFLPDENAIKHTHHFIIYTCYLPADGSLDEAFENSTVDKGVDGDFCFRPKEETVLPFMGEECQEYLFVWAKGGKKMIFPENVGFPIGEYANGKPSYYKLELHFDNPDRLKGVKFQTGVNVYYTDKLREHDAGQLMIAHAVSVSQLIPPNTTDFVTVGHCHPDCTSKFPEEGLNVFNVLLHSHLSGRKFAIRHFRNGVELPFLDYDDHYDFDYQQSKPLLEEIKVLPGDQLACECTYDSKWKKGQVVLGGLSTTEEMCETCLWYWPKQDVDICGSTYPLEQSFSDLGITKYSEVDTGIALTVFNVEEPESLGGDFYESLNNKFNWTKEVGEEIQNKRRFGEHIAFCASRKKPQPWYRTVTYPTTQTDYVPDDICDHRGTGTTTDVKTSSELPSSALKIYVDVFTLILFLVVSLN